MLSATSIRERLEQAIAGLGVHPSDIRTQARAEGIRGIIHDSSQDVVAKLLKNRLGPIDLSVGYASVTVFEGSEIVATVPLSQAARLAVREFDDGKWVELIESE
jgi:hypothetical protein